MFGKPRETPKTEPEAIPELKLPENLVLDSNSQQGKSLATQTKPTMSSLKAKTEEHQEPESSELIITVEKISSIVSPYFIALIGLSLYKDNFFIGSLLISVGILSLLKVSAKDVAAFLEWLKDFLGLGEDTP